MKYDDLVSLTENLTWFDLATLVQLSSQRRQSITNQLYRWARDGRVIHLRRGMYALADRYRRHPINPAALANDLYSPSYLSTEWALGFYGLIPEKVVTLTSVTARKPQDFANAFGRFSYRHLKEDLLFGYRPVHVSEQKILLARPEKALLDHWHLTPGEWTHQRMAGMRYQPSSGVDHDTLAAFAERWGKPRLIRAAGNWIEVQRAAEEGTVEL